MELQYRKYKRRRTGPCNICGASGPLTWDHVPPKGGIELQPVEIDRVAAVFSSRLGLKKPEISHDGLKFRTLCAKCNNKHLGAQFDPALNSLALSVGRLLRSPLALPPVLLVEAQPNAVVRAVLGHLVAARLSSRPGLFDSQVGELILDDSKLIPPNINIFYWIYPYAQQIVLRDALMPAVRGRYADFQRFCLLKYFPLAFLVTTADSYEGLASLTSWRNEPNAFRVQLRIDLHAARDPYWPEAPAPDNWLFGGQELLESIRAHPKPGILTRGRKN
jgi:hypothetical protein